MPRVPSRQLAPGTANVGDVLSWNGTSWVPVVPAGGGSVAPLTDVLYVDAGTLIPLIDQDGSIGKPFSTLTAGITAVPPGGTLLVVTGNYSTESTITINKNLSIQALTPVPEWLSTIANPPGVFMAPNINLATGLQLYVYGAIIGTLDLATSTSLATLEACYISTAVTGQGTLSLVNSGANTIASNTLFASDTLIVTSVSVLGTDVTLRNCKSFGAISIVFSEGPGIATFDEATNRSALSLNWVITNGTKAMYGEINILYAEARDTFSSGTANPSYVPTVPLTLSVSPGERVLLVVEPFTFYDFQSGIDILWQADSGTGYASVGSAVSFTDTSSAEQITATCRAMYTHVGAPTTVSFRVQITINGAGDAISPHDPFYVHATNLGG